MIVHPRAPLGYAQAIEYTEQFLHRAALTDEDRERGFVTKVYDYFDGDETLLRERPWVGVRVSEVGFHIPGRGGSSYMQVDQPWGVAFCGQVERCILALVEGWNRDTTTTDGEEYGETDEEFSRLTVLIEESEKINA